MRVRDFYEECHKEIKKPEVWQPLLLFFLIALIFCGGFIRPHFTTDTYNQIEFSTSQMLQWHLQNGRLLTAFGLGIARVFHLSFEMTSIISTLLAIVFLTFAMFNLYRLLSKDVAMSKIWSILATVLFFVNPFLTELFVYIETSVMLFGILLCVLAAKTFWQYLNTADRKSKYRNLFFTIGLVSLATFCYQGIVGVFIVLATILVIKSAQNVKQFIKDTAISVMCYAVGPVINVLCIKLFFHNVRVGGEIDILESIQRLAGGSVNAIRMFEIIPAWCYWGLFVLIVLVSTVIALKKSGGKRTLLMMAQYAYIAVVTVLAAFAPQILQNSASVWVVPRSTYVFAAMVGVILVISAMQKKFLKTQVGIAGLCFAIVIYLFVVLVGFQRVISSNYVVAEMDMVRSLTIGEKIRQSESVGDEIIKRVMIAMDGNHMFSYPGVFVFGDVNLSTYATDWSDIKGLNYYTGRDFEKVKNTAEWEEFCKGSERTFVDGDLVVVEGDVAKICLF